MISAHAWVARAAAKSKPTRQIITEEEAKKCIQESELYTKQSMMSADGGSDEEEEDGDEHTYCHDDPSLGEEEHILKKYNLDSYKHNDNEDMDDFNSDDDQNEEQGMEKIFANLNQLSLHKNIIEKDPYLIASDGDTDEDPFEEDDDRDDLLIRPTDFLLVGVRSPEEDDIGQIEYYVYEEEGDNLYVHHDIMLPSFPLCIEWINHPTISGESQGNLAAVGSFDEEIEIWDLDVLDPVYPFAVLGSGAKGEKREKKKKSTKKNRSTNSQYHTSAVMCLAWNRFHRNLIASGSADTSIKLWNIESPQYALRSYDVHSDKVQSIHWNPFSPTVLASGSFDRKATVFDTRTPGDIISSAIGGEIETTRWDPFHEHHLAISDDSGVLYYADCRKFGSFLQKIEAHAKAISCVDFHPMLPSILMTASYDKKIKLWDIGTSDDGCGGVPIVSKKCKSGKLVSASFCLDSPFLISYSGSEGDLEVFNMKMKSSFKDTETWENMKRIFEQRIVQ